MSLPLRLCLLLPLAAWCASTPYFQIHVVDRATGRGVPLVALTTVNHIVSFTDSNGIVAWNEPGLMDRDVYFRIESPGYRFPGGGKTLHAEAGGKVELAIDRLSIAERLYRITGQGIYRDSSLTGYPVPLSEPLLNAQVLGQDTVRVVPYRGKLFWLFGDTDRASGPLGNFFATGATSEFPGRGGLDPSVGIDLHYFTGAAGFVKAMCNWPVQGLKWLHAPMTVPDPSGRERLVAEYDVVREKMKVVESGLAVFDDERSEFDKLVVFSSPSPAVGPGGIPPFRVRWGGTEYFYFCDVRPTPVVRVKAGWKTIQDLRAYEVFDGEWKPSPVLPPKQSAWLDVETGQPIDAAAKVAWNEYRKRWIGILQKNPGEVWYAEADTPVGPWVYTTRVATNGKYFFYWPVQHPFFDQDGGREVYFEGTYTDTFSGNPVITPRYNYNQLMYRLSLDDSRLFLPAPVYRLKDGRYLMHDAVEAAQAWPLVDEIPFFALPADRKLPRSVDVGGIFYALPVNEGDASASVLGEWTCGEDLNFAARQQGARIAVEAGGALGSGTMSGKTLEFAVGQGRDAARGTASPRAGKLVVQYQDARNEAGQLTCERADLLARWGRSSAVAPLYFRNGVYATEDPTGGRPIARVWRNPSKKLMLDPKAAPVRP